MSVEVRMIKGGKFGANTQTGVKYEGKVNLADFLKTLNGYEVNEIPELSGNGRSKAFNVLYKNELVAQIFRQDAFYKFLKIKCKFDWRSCLSKRLLPDDSIFVIVNNTFFIIEIKHQNCSGSVDEKLQTCDFKKKQYQKILSNFNCKVEYFYLLSEWFKKPEYKDVLDYIISVGCRYFFEYIPLKELGLPVPNSE